MSLRFIIGSSLSDKTEKIHAHVVRESAAHPERQYVLLVPEQASLTTQQALIDLHPRHALFNIDVLTFNRLSHRVFDEMKVSTKNVLSETGKLMLLKLVVSRHEDELQLLKRNVRRIGFLDELKSVMSELSQYNASAEALRESAGKVGDPTLQKKLQDLGVLYGAYLSLLHENYALSEEKLSLLASVIRDWAPVKDTVFVLDGYTGFTPPQYTVVDALIGHSAGVILGITLGSGSALSENREKDDLFYMSAHMAERVRRLGEARHLMAEEIFAGEDAARAFAPEIRHIERSLFRYPKPAPATEEAAAVEEHANVRLYRAKDKKEEVAIALSEILASIREDKYRYKDIAVVTGDPEGFREEIEAQFSEAGIPYFIDSTKALVNDPLFLLVKGLTALVRNDFAFNDVFSLLKNPLVQKWAAGFAAREDLLEAENYALARGLRGKSAYAREWLGKYKGFDEGRLPALNALREALFAPLLQYAADHAAAGTVREKLDAVRSCLSALQAEEGMAALSQEAEGEAAREYAAAPELLSGLFEEIEKILGDEALSNDEFTDVLQTGLAGTGLRLAPPTKDRLVVGDLMRTRLSGIQKLFVLGANEGMLPRVGDGAGILTDRDREALADREVLGDRAIELAETAKEETFFSHFYLYLLMTLPAKSLTVSYSLTGDDGSSLSPSFAVSELAAVFRGPGNPGEGPPETALRAEKFAPRENLLSTKPSVYRALAEELREYRRADGEGKADPEILTGAPREAALERVRTLASHYAWAFGNDEARTANILGGLFHRYTPVPLSKDLALALYGTELTGSVSRLENFASCPYKHFLDYGIGLREQQRYEADNREIGTLFHESVEAFFRITKEEGRDWAALPDGVRFEYVKKSVERVLENDETGVFSSSNRNKYLVAHAERVTDRSLKTLQHQWNAGGFTDTESEAEFRSRKLKAFSLPLSDGVILSLGGRIDRIDTGEKDGKIYVRVIDYKTGKKAFDYTDFYYGLQLQLLLYLKAAEERLKEKEPGKEIVPAGVYYYILKDDAVSLPKYDKNGKPAEPRDPEDAILESMRLDGLTNTEEDALSMTERTIEARKASTVVTRVKRNKDGSLDASTQKAAVDGEGLKKLSGFALQKAKELSEEISRGNVAVRPAGEGSCRYCAYKTFCGRYGRFPGAEEKKLAKRTREDVLRAAEDGARLPEDGRDAGRKEA